VGSGGKRDSIGAVGPGRVRDRGSIGGKFRPEQVGTGSAGDGENGPGMGAGGGGGGGGFGLPEPSLQEIIEVGAEADNLNPNDVRATAMLLAGSYLVSPEASLVFLGGADGGASEASASLRGASCLYSSLDVGGGGGGDGGGLGA
jgi:hypothetical protein